MTDPVHLHKKLSGKHVVWFGECNQWVGFEEPSYDVYRKYEAGNSENDIIQYIKHKYKLESSKAASFAGEIIAGLRQISYPSEENISSKS